MADGGQADGHGDSGGAFRDATISVWLAEAVEMFIHHVPGRRIVVGSSMGGWIMLLVALARPNLTDPYFTVRAAAKYGYQDQYWPNPYLAGKAL